MATFSYEATTRDGTVVNGTIDVANQRAAVDRLQEMGYYPLRIGRNDNQKNAVSELLASFQGRIREKDIMSFTYQLGVLLEAGFTLDKSLAILSGLTEKKKLKDLIMEVLSQVRGGRSFSDALAKFPEVFPLFYVNMIRAGEAGGFLEDTVRRLAVYLENAQGIREDVRSALIYPLLLGIVGGTAVIVLLTFVVPQFSKIFSDMGQALPLPTVIILAISSALRQYWWIMLILIIAFSYGMRRYLRSERGQHAWDQMKFRLPIFGRLFKESGVARFSRTLGTLLGSGVPILNALQIVQGTLGSEKITEAISAVHDSVRKGKGISDPLSHSGIFPPIAVHMIRVGEESGKLEEMFMKIAERFDVEVRLTVKRLLALLEPALILLMGIAVGFIVIAMLVAVFSINELPF